MEELAQNCAVFPASVRLTAAIMHTVRAAKFSALHCYLCLQSSLALVIAPTLLTGRCVRRDVKVDAQSRALESKDVGVWVSHDLTSPLKLEAAISLRDQP